MLKRECWNVGVDVVSISRFRALPVESRVRFYRKLFYPSELEYCMEHADPYPHLAGTFAAKEAVFKSVSCFGRIYITDIQIDRVNGSGLPVVNLKKFRPIINNVKSADDIEVKISISHDGELALAFAIAVIKGKCLPTSEALHVAMSELKGLLASKSSRQHDARLLASKMDVDH